MCASLEPGLNCLRQERKEARVPSVPIGLSQAWNKYRTNLESGFEGRGVTRLLAFSTCLPQSCLLPRFSPTRPSRGRPYLSGVEGKGHGKEGEGRRRSRRQRCKKRRRKLERTAKSEGKEEKRRRKSLGTALRRVSWWAEGGGARATGLDVCSECCVTREPALFPVHSVSPSKAEVVQWPLMKPPESISSTHGERGLDTSNLKTNT